MRVPIIVPNEAMPKKDPEHPCPCQNKVMELEYKTCLMMWTCAEGDYVTEGQVICEGEVEKKALEFRSPASGRLVDCQVEDDDEFKAGDVLGYIETDI
ncbi:MAG: lipoyl domain-containing protein [Lachnospiraceae bacterium]|nr:lipoyl domain-containing protein [Lachnospiraceae bacterium]